MQRYAFLTDFVTLFKLNVMKLSPEWHLYAYDFHFFLVPLLLTISIKTTHTRYLWTTRQKI